MNCRHPLYKVTTFCIDCFTIVCLTENKKKAGKMLLTSAGSALSVELSSSEWVVGLIPVIGPIKGLKITE